MWLRWTLLFRSKLNLIFTKLTCFHLVLLFLVDYDKSTLTLSNFSRDLQRGRRVNSLGVWQWKPLGMVFFNANTQLVRKQWSVTALTLPIFWEIVVRARDEWAKTKARLSGSFSSINARGKGVGKNFISLQPRETDWYLMWRIFPLFEKNQTL